MRTIFRVKTKQTFRKKKKEKRTLQSHFGYKLDFCFIFLSIEKLDIYI